jgi:hypothetical protein
MFKMILIVPLFFLSTGQAANPCRQDVESLCQAAKGDRKQIAQCLKANSDKLSADCKSRREELKSKFKGAQKACETDAETFCAEIEPGGGRIMKCLRENEKNLSESCRGAFDAARKNRRGADKSSK